MINKQKFFTCVRLLKIPLSRIYNTVIEQKKIASPVIKGSD